MNQQLCTQPINELSCDELTSRFMENISVGDTFRLNDKIYFVKCTGKWKASDDRSYKTLTIKCETNNELIKFFYFFGYEGNPSSKGRNSSVKQHGLLRDIEGQLIVDLLNINNPFHNKSDICLIATGTKKLMNSN